MMDRKKSHSRKEIPAIKQSLENDQAINTIKALYHERGRRVSHIAWMLEDYLNIELHIEKGIYKGQIKSEALYKKIDDILAINSKELWEKPIEYYYRGSTIRYIATIFFFFLLGMIVMIVIIIHLLFDQCENCGKKLILQDIYFKDKRSRQRYAIEITDKGRVFVREWIQSYLSLDSFFNTWNRIKTLMHIMNAD